jgi:hypothetical protein
MLITELEGKDDDWREWVYERKETLIVPMDLAQIEAMQKVMATYAAQGIDTNRITGDPFFIALALAQWA